MTLSRRHGRYVRGNRQRHDTGCPTSADRALSGALLPVTSARVECACKSGLFFEAAPGIEPGFTALRTFCTP